MPQLVQLLELKPGMTIADVGAGFGAWTMRFARRIVSEGRVYASDIGATQLTALRASVQREALNNVNSDRTQREHHQSAATLRRNAITFLGLGSHSRI